MHPCSVVQTPPFNGILKAREQKRLQGIVLDSNKLWSNVNARKMERERRRREKERGGECEIEIKVKRGERLHVSDLRS